MEKTFTKTLLLSAIILAALTMSGCAYSEYGYPYGNSYGYGDTYSGYTYPSFGYYGNYNHGYYRGDHEYHHSKSYGYYGGNDRKYGHYDNDHSKSHGYYNNRNRGHDYSKGRVVTHPYGHIPGNDKNQNPRGPYGFGMYDYPRNDH